MQMLVAFDEDPALMEEMYPELMKDPAFVEVRERGVFFFFVFQF